MKRILQVIYGLHRNGTETAVMNIYRNLDPEKYQFDFLIFDGRDQGVADEIKARGGRIFVMPKRRLFSRAISKAAKDFFCEHASEYSAVHFNFNFLSRLLPFRLAKKYGIPVRLLHSHNSGYLRGKFNYFLHLYYRKITARLTNAHVGCSPEAAKWMFGNTEAEKDCRVIVNGIPMENFLYDPEVREKYRRDLGLVEGQLAIIQVGFFMPVKNHEFTLGIARALKNHVPDVKFIFVGTGGSCEEMLKQRVKEYSLEDNICFLGRRNDVASILQAADIMVMPSIHEGLPLSLVEAQTAGLKAICSTNVSRASRCTENLDFLPIDGGAEPWVERILEIKDYHRENLHDHFENSPYNIKNMAKEFARIYEG